ncbi:alpha/beta hydrolase [Marilutibacter spongiae]|uniref:Alpha/beta hydrolase n=1 Tax=Marilutibacter spongiae TaxID=2025720 RepID=A0A7W3TQ32_9GAMM|nr:alpha/beta hydrolase [Lysobacter spongiae]MBB1062169.1 alpha/beta hydrolase [Lysobacter spongiae]
MASVVILPGLDGTSALLEDFCSTMSGLGVPARAVAYPPDRPLGYAELEPIARAQLPVSTPFVLLGESFSGPLAIRISSDPPPGLVGVVLSTTFARSPVRGLSPLASLVRFAPARPPMPLLSWSLLGQWATPGLQRQLRAALHSVSPAALRARAAAALRVDVSGLLGLVRMPTLQLVASHDRLLASSAPARLSTHLPSCRTVRLAGPHLLLQASTQQAAQAVVAFARGVPADESVFQSLAAPSGSPMQAPEGQA